MQPQPPWDEFPGNRNHQSGWVWLQSWSSPGLLVVQWTGPLNSRHGTCSCCTWHDACLCCVQHGTHLCHAWHDAYSCHVQCNACLCYAQCDAYSCHVWHDACLCHVRRSTHSVVCSMAPICVMYGTCMYHLCHA